MQSNARSKLMSRGLVKHVKGVIDIVELGMLVWNAGFGGSGTGL